MVVGVTSMASHIDPDSPGYRTRPMAARTSSPSRFFFQAQNALAEAANEGGLPASNRPEDVREYVRNALDQNSALTSLD